MNPTDQLLSQILIIQMMSRSNLILGSHNLVNIVENVLGMQDGI